MSTVFSMDDPLKPKMGRPPGSGNKMTAELREAIAKRFPDYNPIIALIEIAHDSTSTKDQKITCHKEVAQYLAPKLKAIEMEAKVDARVGGVLRVSSTLKEEEWAAIAATQASLKEPHES